MKDIDRYHGKYFEQEDKDWQQVNTDGFHSQEVWEQTKIISGDADRNCPRLSIKEGGMHWTDTGEISGRETLPSLPLEDCLARLAK